MELPKKKNYYEVDVIIIRKYYENQRNEKNINTYQYNFLNVQQIGKKSVPRSVTKFLTSYWNISYIQIIYEPTTHQYILVKHPKVMVTEERAGIPMHTRTTNMPTQLTFKPDAQSPQFRKLYNRGRPRTHMLPPSAMTPHPILIRWITIFNNQTIYGSRQS